MPLAGGEDPIWLLDRRALLRHELRILCGRPAKLLAYLVNCPRLAVLTDVAAAATRSAGRLACRALVRVPNVLPAPRLGIVLEDFFELWCALVNRPCFLIDAGQVVLLNLVEPIRLPHLLIARFDTLSL